MRDGRGGLLLEGDATMRRGGLAGECRRRRIQDALLLKAR